jgi:hypothetical protein
MNGTIYDIIIIQLVSRRLVKGSKVVDQRQDWTKNVDSAYYHRTTL